MSPRHFEAMFEKLVVESLEAEDWKSGRRSYKAKACGFDCDATLRVNILAGGDEGRHVTVEFEIFFLNVGGESGACVFSTLRCHVMRPFFQSLVPLYDALFESAEAQLRKNPVFRALDERRALVTAVPTLQSAPATRRPARL